jgi:lambda family phage portal protein
MFEKLTSIFKKAPAANVAEAPAPKKTAYRSGYGAGHVFDGSKYPTGIAGSGRGMELRHDVLRQNARAAYHETVSAHAIVNRFGDTVVNTGLRLEPTPVAEMLGITPEQAKDWGDDVGQRFHLWSKSKHSTLDGTQTFYQMQRLSEIYTWRDNDWFYRLNYNPDRKLQNPVQVQLIDPEQIVGDTVTSTRGPIRFKDGIERDEFGREIGYQVQVQDKDGRWKKVEVPAMSGDRRVMGHCFISEYAGQQRGYPLISHILQELQNLTDFSISEIKKAISQSQIWGFVEPSDDADSSDVIGDMTRKLTNSTVGGASPALDSGTASSDDVEEYVPALQPVYEAALSQPGQTFINQLRAGETIKPFGNTAPATGFDVFFNAVITSLASSASMPPEVLVMKFGENYSASRGALLMFWEVVQIYRGELESDFLEPVYEAWLSEEIAAGRISAPGWSDPRMRAAWLSANWTGLPMPNIDPQRTAEAIRAHLEMNLTTEEREARALNGSSATANKERNRSAFEDSPAVPWKRKEEPTQQAAGGNDED